MGAWSDPFVAVRKNRELAYGPFPMPGSPNILVVAIVDQDVTVEQWQKLAYKFLTDGEEMPMVRAAHEAVRLWGGKAVRMPARGDA